MSGRRREGGGKRVWGKEDDGWKQHKYRRGLVPASGMLAALLGRSVRIPEDAKKLYPPLCVQPEKKRSDTSGTRSEQGCGLSIWNSKRFDIIHRTHGHLTFDNRSHVILMALGIELIPALLHACTSIDERGSFWLYLEYQLPTELAAARRASIQVMN